MSVIKEPDAFSAAIQNAKQFMADNKEMLEQFMAHKNSDAFRQSSAYKLQELLKQLYSDSGYYDVFIPAMRRLSKSYQEYSEALEKANDIFLQTCNENNDLE